VGKKKGRKTEKEPNTSVPPIPKRKRKKKSQPVLRFRRKNNKREERKKKGEADPFAGCRSGRKEVLFGARETAWGRE